MRDYLQGSLLVQRFSRAAGKGSALLRRAGGVAARELELAAGWEDLRKRPVQTVSLSLLSAAAANGAVLVLLHQDVGKAGVFFRFALCGIALLGLLDPSDTGTLNQTSVVLKTARGILRWKRS